MPRFYIIRHGETAGTEKNQYHGTLNMPLSRAGRRQVKSLKKLFNKVPIDYIYTSPLTRCIETATMIKGKRNIPFMISFDLREINFGKWEGLTLNQMYKRNPKKLKSWIKNFALFRMPCGEVVADMVSRTQKFWIYVTRRHKKGKIIIVTHGGPAKTILMKTLGLSLKHFWSFQIDTCSVSIIDCQKDYAVVKEINNTIT